MTPRRQQRAADAEVAPGLQEATASADHEKDAPAGKGLKAVRGADAGASQEVSLALIRAVQRR